MIDHVGRADPAARALILTGAFARGEGTLLEDAPANDYDLVCVRARPGGARLHARLANDLTRRLGLQVDLLPVWGTRLPFVGRKLFWLDLRLGGRVVAGDAAALSRVRAFPAHRLARDEVARLLGNRAAGLLLALPIAGEPKDVWMRDLQSAKAILAALDASLLHAGRYAPSMRERLALSRDHADHALFAAAVEWKLRGAPLPSDVWDKAAACLLRAVAATRARNVGDGAVAHAFYAARAGRLRAGPSRRVREAAWDLLADASWPDGPRSTPRSWHQLTGAAWPQTKARFFEVRARTLH